MARVKGAMMTRKRRNKILKLAKGYWGAKSKQGKPFSAAVAFDAAIEVTAHPVGRAHEYFGGAVVAEVPDAGVFEEAIHNTGDTDITTV